MIVKGEENVRVTSLREEPAAIQYCNLLLISGGIQIERP